MPALSDSGGAASGLGSRPPPAAEFPVHYPHPDPASGRSWHPGGRLLQVPGFGRVHVASEPARGAILDKDTPDIVFLHGYLQSSWSWRANLGRMAEGHRTHAVCVPGYGWSDKPSGAGYRLAAQAERVWRALDAAGVKRTHLMGNSLGASLALQMALLAPQRVGRLVLVNPACRGRYPLAMLSGLQHEVLAPLLGLPGVPTLLQLGLRHAAYANLTVDEQFLQSFLLPLRTPGAGRAALQVARYFNRDMAALEARLCDVSAPALVVWGQCDRIVPLSAVQRLQRALPAARLELFDCSGHCPMEEEPRRFNRQTLQFLHETME